MAVNHAHFQISHSNRQFDHFLWLQFCFEAFKKNNHTSLKLDNRQLTVSRFQIYASNSNGVCAREHVCEIMSHFSLSSRNPSLTDDTLERLKFITFRVEMTRPFATL